MEASIVFILQVSFQVLRTAGTFTIVHNKMLSTMVISFLIQIVWLFSTYIGVVSIMENDWVTVIMYVAGGLLGTYLGMLMHPDRKKG